MKKEIIFVLMVISALLISACDVYNTLYIKQAKEGAEEISEEEIVVEGFEEEVEIEIGEEEKEISEEAEEKEIPEDATVLIV